MNSFHQIVLFALGMFGIGWVAVRFLVRRGTAEYEHEREQITRIAAMSITEAALKATSLLSDTTRFRCAPSPPCEDSIFDRLPQEVERFFRTYESVESLTATHAILARSLIAPSAVAPGFLRIGTIESGTDVQGDLGVRGQEETIYELYPAEEPDPTFGMYKSIHHWILAAAGQSRLDSAAGDR
ncbi:MAG TPA: hypothetical protein VEK11_26265 [Thermoanaerobaculia bacterium]|nr:hypothetical protein [Thermoanaerobaculia bacterium]